MFHYSSIVERRSLGPVNLVLLAYFSDKFDVFLLAAQYFLAFGRVGIKVETVDPNLCGRVWIMFKCALQVTDVILGILELMIEEPDDCKDLILSVCTDRSRL